MFSANQQHDCMIFQAPTFPRVVINEINRFNSILSFNMYVLLISNSDVCLHESQIYPFPINFSEQKFKFSLFMLNLLSENESDIRQSKISDCW